MSIHHMITKTEKYIKNLHKQTIWEYTQHKIFFLNKFLHIEYGLPVYYKIKHLIHNKHVTIISLWEFKIVPLKFLSCFSEQL